MGTFDVEPNLLIESLANELKKIKDLEPPEWAKFVKTSPANLTPPLRPDWWYIRTAALLRKFATLKGSIGVEKLRTLYGRRQRRGTVAPKHFKKASGSIIRKALQKLEKAGLVQKVEKPRKGRKITPKGFALLDKVANQIMKEKAIVIPKKIKIAPPPKKLPKKKK